jgi:hypothetical protein
LVGLTPNAIGNSKVFEGYSELQLDNVNSNGAASILSNSLNKKSIFESRNLTSTGGH